MKKVTFYPYSTSYNNNCFTNIVQNKNWINNEDQTYNILAGGIAGRNYKVISGCYNKASIQVYGKDSVYMGGICGITGNSSSVQYCYNRAEIKQLNTLNGSVCGGGICGLAGSVDTVEARNGGSCMLHYS